MTENTMKEILKTVKRKEESTGYRFSVQQVASCIRYTVRKCLRLGKGEEYIPVLFQTELDDYLFRNTVNTASVYKMQTGSEDDGNKTGDTKLAGADV